ncbi:hypothetical protein PGT21_002249 [Puccinia graminis f. sp. tritici]|uniref:Uncharacterized protein n=1 Tax=Puccinia graminis f. sp. tritici TaxID=56615 RepID=A0A5B0ME08_PUCGR|nr:hypothetical protein PGT21_002249 [Puccinia graminis f. sp. tritici]
MLANPPHQLKSYLQPALLRTSSLWRWPFSLNSLRSANCSATFSMAEGDYMQEDDGVIPPSTGYTSLANQAFSIVRGPWALLEPLHSLILASSRKAPLGYKTSEQLAL